MTVFVLPDIDLADGVAQYDESYFRKQPDWTCANSKNR
mgnify:CR=1 FL=1